MADPQSPDTPPTTEPNGPTRPADSRPPDSRGGQVDPKLLEILVCPVSHTRLRYDAEKQELISDAAGLAYPIRDGIPIMLQDEARPLKVTE
ncbi:MAG: Trm112 family protein [Alphaproteobacteria bacterium]